MDEVELDEFGYAKPPKPAYLRYGDPNNRVVVDEAADTWYDRQEDINRRNWHFEMRDIADELNYRMLSEWNQWISMAAIQQGSITVSEGLERLAPKKKVKPQAYNFEDYKPYKRKRFN